MPEKSKFIVTYEVQYVHRVQVGVTAFDHDSAILTVRNALDTGSILDDCQAMPLLYDEYNEVGGDSLNFIAEPVDSFPVPDVSVNDYQRKENAFKACSTLVQAMQLAMQVFADQRLASAEFGLIHFQCHHCGRVYDDADQCHSEDCPSFNFPLNKELASL